MTAARTDDDGALHAAKPRSRLKAQGLNELVDGHLGNSEGG